MNVTAQGTGLQEILQAIEQLTKQEVLVGIPHGETRADSEMTNAQIGYLHETGSPSQNIPARAFLVPGIESCQNLTSAHLVKAAEQALQGNTSAVNRHLNLAGSIAERHVRMYFVGGHFEPLSEVTIRQRRLRGRTGINPLIDTAQLRKSVTYVIQKRGESWRT